MQMVVKYSKIGMALRKLRKAHEDRARHDAGDYTKATGLRGIMISHHLSALEKFNTMKDINATTRDMHIFGPLHREVAIDAAKRPLYEKKAQYHQKMAAKLITDWLVESFVLALDEKKHHLFRSPLGDGELKLRKNARVSRSLNPDGTNVINVCLKTDNFGDLLVLQEKIGANIIVHLPQAREHYPKDMEHPQAEEETFEMPLDRYYRTPDHFRTYAINYLGRVNPEGIINSFADIIHGILSKDKTKNWVKKLTNGQVMNMIARFAGQFPTHLEDGQNN